MSRVVTAGGKKRYQGGSSEVAVEGGGEERSVGGPSRPAAVLRYPLGHGRDTLNNFGSRWRMLGLQHRWGMVVLGASLVCLRTSLSSCALVRDTF